MTIIKEINLEEIPDSIALPGRNPDRTLCKHSNTPCVGCPNKSSLGIASKLCGSYGSQKPRIVIIGESPGAKDIASQIPFSGDSGRLLFHTLNKLGYFKHDDTTPYFLNAIKCYPKKVAGNVTQKQIALAVAIHACNSSLNETLQSLSNEEHKPDIIIALGNGANWAATNDYKARISNVRGTLVPSPYAKLGVFRTYHPAFLLRNSGNFAQWKGDLEYALSLLEGNAKKAPRPHTYEIVDTVEAFHNLVDVYGDANLIAADVETMGFRYVDDALLNLGITSDLHNGTHVHIIPDSILYNPECFKALKSLMENQAKWIWHNGKFDIKFFRKMGIQAKVDHDTMLGSYTLNENGGIHDLEQCSMDWLGAPDYKDILKPHFPNGVKVKDRNYGMLPRDILYKYAAWDVTYTYQIFEKMYPLIESDEKNNLLYNSLLIPASETLAQIEMNGLILDWDVWKANKALLDGEIDQARQEVMQIAASYGMPELNPKSNVQLKHFIYDVLKLKHKSGKADKDSLEEMDHPVIKPLLTFKNRIKRASTYVDNIPGLLQSDGLIHPSFKIHGTVTGRLSASQPNVQNIPRGPLIRSQYKAPDDHVIIEVDLNQAELRSLAIMSGDKTLIDIYTKNEVSIHHITSVAFFGPNYTDEDKMRAKAVNFGIVYGRSAASLAEEFGIPVAEAQRWIDAWFETYPGAKIFIDTCRTNPLNNITMSTVFGRRKRATVVSPENTNALQNEASNFPHQSTASDIVLKASCEIITPLKERFGGRIFNLIHDACLYYIRNDEDLINESIKYVQSVMERIPREYGLTLVPFIAEAKVGTSWGAIKSYHVPS